MVFFVCETCNETLKKNQVQKHVLKCRRCDAVTCVDCSVTFYGDDFEGHTTCISEAEKYEKSLHVAKKVKLNPQDSWISTIEKAVENIKGAPIEIQSHLQRIQEFSNIPRNKNKFMNFCKNSLRLFQEPVAVKLWEFLDTFRTTSQANESKVTVAEVTPEVTDKKTKRDESSSTLVDDLQNENEKEKKKAKKLKKEKVSEEVEVVAEVAVQEEQPTEKMSKKAKKKDKKQRKAEENVELHEE